MTIPLQYDFSIVGFQRVDHALRSVERRVVDSNRRMSRNLGVSPAQTRRGARPSTSAARGFTEIAKVAEREEMRRHRQAMLHRSREERTHLKGIASIGAAARREEMRRHRAAMQDAQRERVARSKFIASTVGNGARNVARTTRAIGSTGAALLGLGGGAMFAGAFNAEKKSVAAATELANKAFGTPGETRDRGQLQKDILRSAKSEGIRSGLGSAGSIEAMRQFVGISGNMRAAEASLPYMVDIANATGANIGDVGRTGGQIAQAIFARDPEAGTDPEKMAKALADVRTIMGAMAGQAKVGSIEFADLATQMGKVMSATAAFDGDIADLAKTMAAVGQLAVAGGASSPEEAMTAIMNFRDDLVTNSKKFKKIADSGGVNVFADKGQTKLRDPMEIILDMLDATKGDLGKISELFGKRAKKAVDPFQAVFTEAGGGEAGVAAFKSLLGNITGASMSDTEVRESAAFRVAQTDRKFSTAMEQFDQAVGEQLLPAVTDLIPHFVALAPAAGDLAAALADTVKWFSSNPFEGLGILVLGIVAKDLAMAGIGAAVKSVLVASAAGQAAGGAAGGAAAGVGAKALGGAGAAAAGAGVIGSGFLATTVLGKGIGASGALGTGALAAGGVAAALYSNTKLKEVTGGEGIGQFVTDLFKSGSFEGAYKAMDERANQRAKAEGGASGMVNPIAEIPPDVLDKLNRSAELQLKAAEMNQSAAGKSGMPNRTADPTVPRSGS